MTKRSKNVNLIINVIGVDFNKHKIKMPYKDLKKKEAPVKRAETAKIVEEVEEVEKVEEIKEVENVRAEEVKEEIADEAATTAEKTENSDVILMPPVPVSMPVPEEKELDQTEQLEQEQSQEKQEEAAATASPTVSVSLKSKIASLFSFASGFSFNFRELIQKYQKLKQKLKPKIKDRHKGFSLIEVAIAIVVIGLVVGLSLKGKELIHTAKVNSVIDQVNSFRIATQMFTEKYGAMPGDFADAKNSIDDSLENGKGVGLISSLDDAKRFWSHLTKAGMLTVELMGGFPVSKLGGYYSVSSDINENDGLWLVLTRGTADNKSFSGIISQEDAAIIDKKYDNGDPSSGDIRTKKVEGNSGKPAAIGKKYDPKSKSKNCVIMFKLW